MLAIFSRMLPLKSCVCEVFCTLAGSGSRKEKKLGMSILAIEEATGSLK